MNSFEKHIISRIEIISSDDFMKYEGALEKQSKSVLNTLIIGLLFIL